MKSSTTSRSTTAGRLCVLALALCSALFTSACGPAFSSESCRAAVVKDAGTDNVTNVPGKDFSFIVRKPDGSVWIYKTMSGGTPDVTERLMLFGPLSPNNPHEPRGGNIHD